MEAVFMAIITTRPFEDLFGWLTYNNRGHDDGLISNSSEISSAPKSIELLSPDVGPSGSPMTKSYASSAIGGSNKMPSFTWSSGPEIEYHIQEYLLVAQDPDAPLPDPIVHGIYLGINKEKKGSAEADFEVENAQTRELKGGFHYGQSRSGQVYITPRPIMQHGAHRYFWTIVGLMQRVDWNEVRRQAGEKGVGKSEVLEAVKDKVVAWGQWHGTYEQGR